jgi:hypothetical protein
VIYFNEQKWDELIQDPLWYTGMLWDECDALLKRAEHDTTQSSAIKKAVRGYFADRLERSMVALGAAGDDLDYERKPIDTLVIHHTSGAASNYTLPYLNATQLLRIYVPPYRNGESHAGQPIWSGHFYSGQQVFWGYHWFIFENGAYTRILPDTAIGWHSGNWDVNTRSVGICFAGNFTEQAPNTAMITAAQNIIGKHYADEAIRIIGHYETPRDTTCPGDTFPAWRNLLRA